MIAEEKRRVAYINEMIESGRAENRADTKELRREFGLSADGVPMAADPIVARMTRPQMEKYIAGIQQQMKEAAKRLDFLQAAQYRDEIIRLQKELELK